MASTRTSPRGFVPGGISGNGAGLDATHSCFVAVATGGAGGLIASASGALATAGNGGGGGAGIASANGAGFGGSSGIGVVPTDLLAGGGGPVVVAAAIVEAPTVALPNCIEVGGANCCVDIGAGGKL